MHILNKLFFQNYLYFHNCCGKSKKKPNKHIKNTSNILSEPNFQEIIDKVLVQLYHNKNKIQVQSILPDKTNPLQIKKIYNPMPVILEKNNEDEQSKQQDRHIFQKSIDEMVVLTYQGDQIPRQKPDDDEIVINVQQQTQIEHDEAHRQQRSKQELDELMNSPTEKQQQLFTEITKKALEKRKNI